MAVPAKSYISLLRQTSLWIKYSLNVTGDVTFMFQWFWPDTAFKFIAYPVCDSFTWLAIHVANKNIVVLYI